MPSRLLCVALSLVFLLPVPVLADQDADAAPAGPRRYDQYRVVRVQVETKQQFAEVDAIVESFWSHDPAVGAVEVVVSPVQLEALRAMGLDPQTLVPDVQALIDVERAASRAGSTWFESYHSYDDIVGYMNQLVATYPALASMVNVGTTVEGRTIWGIRIAGANLDPFAPSVIYFSTVHAREWIAATVPQYLATHLLENYGTDVNVTDLVDSVEWILIPVGNPDGYVYSWNSLRLWRKNRRNNGDGTFGVDINRNWGYEWGGAGTSSDPSSDIYRGPFAFSEPETQALRDLFLAMPSARAQLDIHSYSQIILWPWGFKDELTPDQALYAAIGTMMQQLIQQVHGQFYTAGPVFSAIYPVSGGSVDWTYALRNILSFSFELRPTTSNPGFVLPPDQIIPNNEEILPAVLYMTGTDAVRATQFNYHQDVPEQVTIGQDVTIPVTVTSGVETLQAATATLYYRYDLSGPFIAAPMSYLGGPSFEAVLPATNCLSQPEYYFSIEGSAGTTVDPVGAPATTYTATMASGTETFFVENLDGDPGWSRTGLWAYGQPTGGGGEYGSPDPTGGHTGPSVFGYNLSGDYENSLPERHLTTSAIDCTGRSGIHLSFWRWLGVEQPEWDHAYIRISTNGTDWTTVWENTVEVADAAWTLFDLDISAWADNQPTVYLRWTMGPTDSAWRYCGWNIDDVSLYSSICTLTMGDINGDALVNQTDYDGLATCFTGDGVTPYGPGCGIFDFDSDNDVDCTDGSSFAAAWSGGAPPVLPQCGGAPPSPLPASGYPHAAKKNRYVSFTADPLLAGTPHGYRLAHPGSGQSYFISTPRTTPAAIQGKGLTYLVADGQVPEYDFAALPVVHVGGCLIAPGESYEIRATTDGVLYSNPLAVTTAASPSNGRWWGDVVGSFQASGDGSTVPPTPPGAWSPPDGNMNGFDISAVLQTFVQVPGAADLTWADVNSQQPDRLANGGDILQVVNAFQVGSGREYYPFAVPLAPGPQGQAACPVPPLLADLDP